MDGTHSNGKWNCYQRGKCPLKFLCVMGPRSVSDGTACSGCDARQYNLYPDDRPVELCTCHFIRKWEKTGERGRSKWNGRKRAQRARLIHVKLSERKTVNGVRDWTTHKHTHTQEQDDETKNRVEAAAAMAAGKELKELYSKWKITINTKAHYTNGFKLNTHSQCTH